MKKMNNKGFTLIELLAVIVILAIVTVLASQSILPFMQNAGKNSFAIEANGAIDSASNAVSLLSIGSIDMPKDNDKNFKRDGDKYCFTLDWLVDKGLYDLDVKSLESHTDGKGSYAGKVEVTKSGNAYTYTIFMHNKEYYVTGSGTIDKDDPLKIADAGSPDYDCE